MNHDPKREAGKSGAKSPKNFWHGLAICLFAAGHAAALTAQDGFGIGFILGSPSGVSASLPIGKTNAFNAVLGYDLNSDANLYAQGDYVWIHEGIIPVESGKISLYYGPGAFAIVSKNAAVGIRAVGGIDYRFEGAPVQLFLEIGPGINILPDTKPVGTGGLGLRYYF